MAETYTSNLGLTKPDYDSPADISVINSNMDKIDNAVANAGKVKSVNKKTGEVTLTAADVGALGKNETAANANQLNGKSADQYALKTDLPTKASDVGALASDGTAADSLKLGGKDSVYYLGARNLLDNSDFRNPVNQRGQTSFGGSGYFIDRWYIGGEKTPYASVEYGDLRIYKNDGSSASIVQIQENASKLNGKTMTLAINILNHGIEVMTFTYGASKEEVFADGRMSMAHQNGDRIIINSFDAGWVAILWAALYEGSYTAETLPPYVPKGYVAELAECQRYYYRMSVSGNSGETNNIIGSGYWSSATDLRVQFTLPQVMRMSTPTVSTIGDGLASGVSGSIVATPITALSRLWNCVGNNITLLATSTGGAAGAFGYLRLSVNGGIEVSADL